MQNIGVGGVLTFNSTGAVAGMGKASGALDSLHKSASNFKSSLAGATQSLGAFNIAGAALGAAGIYGFGALIKKTYEAQTEFEDLHALMATTLGVVQGMGDAEALKVSADLLDRIEATAAVIPGESKDLAKTFQMTLGPLTKAGKSYDEILQMSTGITLAAAGMGVQFNDAAKAASKMAGGTAEMGSDFFGGLRGLGLITETAGEWNKLAPEKRAEKMAAVFKKFEEHSALTANTWSALAGTIQSVAKLIMRSIGGPVMDKVKEKLMAIFNPMMTKEGIAGIREWGTAIGENLIYYLDLAILVGRKLISWAKEAYAWFKTLEVTISSWGAKLGLTDQSMESMAVNLGAMAIAVGTIVPILATLMPVFGLMGSLLKVVTSGLGTLMTAIRALPALWSAIAAVAGPALLPIALVVGGLVLLFLAIRKEGESFMDTMRRMWTDGLKPFLTGIMEGFMRHWDNIKYNLMKAWEQIKKAVFGAMDKMAGSFNLNADSAQSWGDTIGTVIGWVAEGFTYIVSAVARFLPPLLEHLATAWSWISWFASGVVTVFTVMHDVIKTIFGGLAEIIMTPLRWMARQLAWVLQKLYQIPGAQTLLDEVGLGVGADVWLNELGGGLWKKTGGKDGAEIFEMVMPGEAGYDQLKKEQDDKELKDAMGETGKAIATREQSRQEQPTVKIDQNLHNCVKIDGKEVAMANSRYTNEIQERAGAGTTPWQKRSAVIRAADYTGKR